MGEDEAHRPVNNRAEMENMNEKITLSFSIVTYNNEEEIRNVLNSVLQVNPAIVKHIYVIDNGSADDTVKIVQNEYKTVECICTGENLGYGAGHNVAIMRTDTNYHIILNPDIVFAVNTIEEIIRYLEAHEETVMCIPRIEGFDNEEQNTPRRDPSIRFLVGSLLNEKFKKTAKWNREYRMINDETEPFSIEFCSGCFMAARTDALKQIKGFDPRYFLYFEDADLTRRIRELGKVEVVPFITIVHEGKREARKNMRGLLRFMKSAVKYFNKWGWKI